jgi:hypothetical protein
MAPVKCADIPDDVFLAAVTATPPMHPGMTWRSRWAVHDTLQQQLAAEVPEKLALAKARKLIARKKLAGCACGCRGDYHLPGEG